MPVIRRGVENASPGRSNGDRKKNLWLKNGDNAKFWFVTEGSEAVIADVHIVHKMGQKGKPYTLDVLCTKSDGACANCDTPAEGDSEAVERWFFWVYVEGIAHPDHKDPSWRKSKVGVQEVFVEDVNDIWLFVPKFRLSKQVKEAYATYGTLLDRRWRLKRTGDANQTQEALTPESEESPMPRPEAALAAAAAVGDLETYIVEQFSPKGNRSTTTAPVARPAVTTEDIPAVDLVAF